MDFILKYRKPNQDTFCIAIIQPNPEEFNCKFEFYADVGLTKSEVYNLENITIDSINGVGEICFIHEPVVYLVGEFFHVKEKRKSLFQYSKKLNLDKYLYK